MMHISPRPRKHPIIRAHYVNGTSKSMCCRNLEKEQILQKAELLRDASGVKNRKLRAGRFVTSMNESVRGVWSALHADVSEGGSRTWEKMNPKKPKTKA